MRCHTFRLVRLTTVIFPCLWFIYVVHVVFISDDDPSLRSRTVFPEAQNKAGQHERPYSDDGSVKKLPRDKEVVDDESHGGGESNKGEADAGNGLLKQSGVTKKRQGVIRIIQARKDFAANRGLVADMVVDSQGEDNHKEDQNRESQEEDDSDDQEQDYVMDDSAEAVNHGDSLRVGPERDAMKGLDVDGDAVKQRGDVDSYADVTYPPYVETLPSGARGR